MAKGIFVTATGTDAGKTFISGLLIKKLRQAGFHTGYYKAVLSGAVWQNGQLIPGDAAHVKQVAGIEAPVSEMVSYVYENAVSPHLAAEMEERPIDKEKIMEDYIFACSKYDYLTVEGSGGIICPIRRGEPRLMLADLIKTMGLGILIVAPSQLGTINSTALTVEYARSCGIPVKGIVLNRFHEGDNIEEDNLRFIEEFTGIPVVAQVKEDAAEIEIDPALLARLYE